ncbi:unnamed protein product [Prorocentrum cordatum]|uniref:Uncharacterized protein n=1 Tax=Prorocentrum cordatum TaxID=2364126 RepID=A0ABN9UYS7_9DINO|nr:unnamed protein product [Polarella glacialis]
MAGELPLGSQGALAAPWLRPDAAGGPSERGEGAPGYLARTLLRLLVYAARCFIPCWVCLAWGRVQQDPCAAPREGGGSSRGIFAEAGFPIRMFIRVAQGMAACTWGGRDL